MKPNASYKSNAPEAAFGLKAHSGWAALVVLGSLDGEVQVLERSRMELIEAEWQKQPYHAAEELSPAEARTLVKSGINAVRRITLREMKRAVKRVREYGFEVRTCAVLVGSPMPNWSVAEILAVHFRMHKAEGVLFREVLAAAARACDLKLAAVPEKILLEYAASALATRASSLLAKVGALGKSVGAPWGKDQKDATIAAMIALHGQADGLQNRAR
ncbi:MAG TPA: hypothetical protein VGO68_20460 [Pyrinomonadaceae bacterium]|nr:hypothetical protein [Pyrinomonadaceae bacterium]